MSTITAPPNHLTTPTTTTVRAGLALSAIIGLGNLPFLFLDIDWGAEEPPFALLLLNAAIGMVSVVCVALAWNSGNRKAIRINAAALIINALMVLPGLFMETPAFITITSAVIVVATLVAVVLTMRRSDEPLSGGGLMTAVRPICSPPRAHRRGDVGVPRGARVIESGGRLAGWNRRSSPIRPDSPASAVVSGR